jgi:hypothetical protein
MFCKALISAHIAFGSPKKTRNEKDVGLKVKGSSKLFLKRFGVWTTYPFCASSSYSFTYGIQKGIVDLHFAHP